MEEQTSTCILRSDNMANFIGGICIGIFLMCYAEYHDEIQEREERKRNAKRKTRR